jgi:DNA-binding CsgD family transcriptional regulator
MAPTSPIFVEIPHATCPNYSFRESYRSFSDHAHQEALAMFLFVKQGERVDAIRDGIKPNRACDASMIKYRFEILLAFDVLRIKPGRPVEITPELRAEIVRLLRLNFSQKQVARALRMSASMVWRVAKPAAASTLKRGRGRRFTSGQIEAIRAAIRAGDSSKEIIEAFHIHPQTVKKFRIQLGDTTNYHFDRKLSARQVAEIRAHLAAHSLTWKEMTARYGISIALIGFIKRRVYGY